MVTVALCCALLFGGAAADAATCSRKPLAQTQTALQSFKFRPAGLLDRFPKGDSEFSGILAELVSVDPDGTLDKALDLLKTANIYQRRAIGAGLGRVAQICQQNGQSEIARRVGEALRRRVDRDAMMTFTAITTPTGTLPLPTTRSDDTSPSRLTGRAVMPDTKLFGSQPLNDPLRALTPR